MDGIVVDSALNAIVDHNELSGFTHGSVIVNGQTTASICRPPRDYRLTPPKVKVVRNFIHHNRSQGEGYGVVTGAGGKALIQGNTFEENRHAIASTYQVETEYYAYENLVMPAAPVQVVGWLRWLRTRWGLEVILASVPDSWYTHDFDVHGSAAGSTIDFEDGLVPPHAGGNGGCYFEITANAFGNNRENLDLRGTPCLGASFFYNVTRRSQDDAITDRSNGNVLNVFGNTFSAAGPTQTLGLGDFDGDGQTNRFLATGAAWYYQPASTLEWRYLRASDVAINRITLQDVDGDSRTDATYKSGHQTYASWAARSIGEVIATDPIPPQEEEREEPPIPPGGQRP